MFKDPLSYLCSALTFCVAMSNAEESSHKPLFENHCCVANICGLIKAKLIA